MDTSKVLRPVTPIRADSTVHIYRLPNELLELIFSFLFASSKYTEFRNDANAPILVPSVLVVRWVCAWFRKLASYHPIWVEGDSSDISNFVPLVDGVSIGNRGKFLEG